MKLNIEYRKGDLSRWVLVCTIVGLLLLTGIGIAVTTLRDDGIDSGGNLDMNNYAIENAKLGTDFNASNYGISDVYFMHSKESGTSYFDALQSTGTGWQFRSENAAGVQTNRLGINSGSNTVDIDINNAVLDLNNNAIANAKLYNTLDANSKNITSIDYITDSPYYLVLNKAGSTYLNTGVFRMYASSVQVGNGASQVNITLTSPNGSEWCCGVDNTGSYSCSAGTCG